MSRQENAAVLSIQMGNEEAVRVDEELALAREQARQKWRSERRNSRDRVETGGHEEVKEERKDSDVGQAGVDAEVAEVVNEFDRIPSSAESSGPPCSICLQEWDRHKKGVKMPCCWGKGSTWYCRPCVDLLFQLSPLGLVKCPNCSANVVMSEGGQLKSPKVVEIKKECRYCKRADQIIISWGLCADCTLGSQHCFKYECDTCGNLQRIAFPPLAMASRGTRIIHNTHMGVQRPMQRAPAALARVQGPPAARAHGRLPRQLAAARGAPPQRARAPGGAGAGAARGPGG
eukprot:CAMPEP_0206396578 /NCGR_PEP_ID=MMETSP0294-20121207/22872_1 /ASSEMBLY_ACC=CAM_ASM_000327 /TAXON_ID=39354 /ORGANISM="Heterosigma akashiwo, Strain CCMP2393" /LENGTH=287 /DNA_ID=CAMNT_0053851343 /DNA_START=75 /DNA_END=933 /DNA_ORIENTATION=-